MQASLRSNNQAGYSVIEMIIAATVMLIITSAVVALMKNSLTIATATYEMTDAQENLRSAQEWVNRDLMNAGDGLKSITYIPVNTTFLQTYLTRAPIVDATMPQYASNLGILTTDNNVPVGTTVPGPPPPPGPSPLPSPTPITLLTGTDRQTILEIDPDLATNPQLLPTAISANGDVVTLPAATTAADMGRFNTGDIYFLTSSRGGAFGTVTAIDTVAKTVTFGADAYGLNTAPPNNRFKDIATGGATTLQRMRIIHYFVDSNGLLRRRVFGERGAAFRDNVIAEHVLSVQFVYSLGLDSNGDPVQPTDTITTPAQQVNISQVYVTVTVETPHALQQGARSQVASTTSTSLRNMQFRQALQPRPTPTP